MTITGAIHNVYFARQQLLGSLPLVLMFEMPENHMMSTPDQDPDAVLIQKLQDKLSVTISVKPKQRRSTKSVLIKAQVHHCLQ